MNDCETKAAFVNSILGAIKDRVASVKGDVQALKAAFKPAVEKYFGVNGNSKQKTSSADYIQRFNHVMSTYFANVLGNDRVKGIAILGNAYSAAAGDGNVDREVGGHAYPALIYYKPVIIGEPKEPPEVFAGEPMKKPMQTYEIEQYVQGKFFSCIFDMYL